jgi:hypothetical protein
MKPEARRFLSGLSADELQFIAQYLGACILECGSACLREFPRTRVEHSGADRDLKMILVREYLCRAVAHAVN